LFNAWERVMRLRRCILNCGSYQIGEQCWTTKPPSAGQWWLCIFEL